MELKINSVEYINSKLEESVDTLNRLQSHFSIDADELEEMSMGIVETISNLSEVLYAIGGYREILRRREQGHRETKNV